MDEEFSSRDGAGALSLGLVLSGRVRKKEACSSDSSWEASSEG